MSLHNLKMNLRNKTNSNKVWANMYRRGARFKTLIFKLLPDKTYIKIQYYFSIGRKLNLDNPVTYTEKVQWLKLYDRKPLYTQLADKIEVKKYVESKIGKAHIVPTYGVWNSFDEIDFEKLPDSFVLKCNHDCGSVIIVKDKKKFDKDAARKKLEGALKINYFWGGREWPYKNISPKIFAEKLLEDESQSATKGITDYKVFCFNGKAKLILVVQGRFDEICYEDFYDSAWNKTQISQPRCASSNDVLPRPTFLEKMIELSEILAKEIPLIRVDWFYINNTLYSGEMTFFDGGGFDKLGSYEQDKMMGSFIDLPVIVEPKGNAL